MTSTQITLPEFSSAFDYIEPMTPVVSEELNSNSDLIYEIQWEGLRVVSVCSNGSIALHTRGAQDVTIAFPEITLSLQSAIEAHDIIVDGEIVALDENDLPQRHAVMERWLTSSHHPNFFRYEISDILYLDGKWLLDMPLYKRKKLLHKVIKPVKHVHICRYSENDGSDIYGFSQELGLHGILVKDKFSAYEPGKRSPSWISLKYARTANLVIGGYTFGGTVLPFGTLLVGAFDQGEFRYLGNIGGGFGKCDVYMLYQLISRLHTDECPFINEPNLESFFYWCDPVLAVEIEFGELSPSGEIRFPLFNSLRPDIDSKECDLPLQLSA
ncbi:MAG: hypothetical protein CL743_02745 [Chloroflexi bacterium]|nr:hypothetical protein [Chloroflexota bacterium]MCH2531510.1 hypothetical protein [Dehalococcoidia bacterium]HCH36092.1 hypothetical protein [Dehalococcoidia bacterium]|tara:strand:- start:1907 stop:2887 length:981 start_codon:yes stop_codon:yes gene_type:complete